jgi:hypothetical protein
MIKSVARVTALARYPLAFGASWQALTATGKEVTGG